MEEEISKVHKDAQATTRKIDAGNANILVVLSDFEAKTQVSCHLCALRNPLQHEVDFAQVSISGIENNLTLLQLGVDEMLNGEFSRLRVTQQNLSRAIFSSEIFIDKLQDEMNVLKQWQSAKLKKSLLEEHFRSEIMKKVRIYHLRPHVDNCIGSPVGFHVVSVTINDQ